MRYLKVFLSALLTGLALPVFAAGIPVKLYKNPNCGCCNAYVDYLRGNGFDVEAINTTDLSSVRQKYSVPERLEGCHVALTGGYVFEGLVPAEYVNQVLREHRMIRGLSLPGMPPGAPGMPGMAGAKREPLRVYYLSSESSPRVFAEF